MEGDILKNTGRFILSLCLCLCLCLFLSGGLYAVEIETELSPARIAAGESASLRIKVTGKSGGVKPVKFPAVSGLQITFSGSSRNFQFVNGRTWSGTVLNFSIYGEKKGEYKIPPFILEADGERVSSREVILIVGESSSGGNGDRPLRGDVSLSTDSVYAGEPFVMRYFVYDGFDNPFRIEGFSEQPHVKGFVMKGLDERVDDPGRTYAGSFCLVPVENGVHQIGGGTVDVAVEMARGFFSMSGRKRIVFPYKKITVIPIPVNGKPENFSGDVGEFKIEAKIPSGEFKIYEEIKIQVKISGRGNLLTLSKPRIGNDQGIKTIVEEGEQTLSVSEGGLSGEKNFLITVIPQKDGDINAGHVFIEYFNPYKKIYEKAESAPISFTVQKGAGSAEKGEVQFSSDGSFKGNSVYIYGVLIISGLVLFIIALVLWERKKLRMIRSELGTDAVVDSAVPEIKKSDEIISNIRTALKDKDSEMFILNADRGINLIDTEKLPSSEMNKYNHFKEKVYFSRYGGGVFAESEMNELSEWLRRNIK